MNMLINDLSYIKILPILIFLFIIPSFTGCNGFDIPDGAVMVPPEDPDEPDSGHYGILSIDSCNIEIGSFNCQTNAAKFLNSGLHGLKYYEVEESYAADFSGTLNTIITNESKFKISSSNIKKYYRARAVFDDSISEWSNVVAARKSI